MPDNVKYFTTLRGASHLLTTFSIPLALVALTLEIDGDVTERGGEKTWNTKTSNACIKSASYECALSNLHHASVVTTCQGVSVTSVFEPLRFFCFGQPPEHHFQCFGCDDDGIGSH